ncbi:MAG: MerR family transcriptional regulator [Hyphomicrobiales bacterium]
MAIFKHIESLNTEIRLHDIAKVCEALGTSEREIDFYRRRGLLCEHLEGTCPLLTSTDVTKLKVILADRRAGFKTSEIAAMIRQQDAKHLKKLEKKFTLLQCEAQFRLLEQKKQELSDSILNLERKCLAIMYLRGTSASELPSLQLEPNQ